MDAGREKVEAVVIGASAGGVDALTTLLARLPARFGLPIVAVVHIPPDNDGLLTEVLAHSCPLPVREVEDKTPVAGGAVYLAPPNYHALVEPDRCFALSVDDPVHYCRPSIDVLFESAAFAYRGGLLGIVLTGANADGADGLAHIRRLGGRAWVQEPTTAYASAMPASALERAGADRVMTLPEIAAELAALGGA